MTDFNSSKGAKTLYNYFIDFINENELGTSNYSSATGQKKYQELFIEFLEWAKSVNYGEAPLELQKLVADEVEVNNALKLALSGAAQGKILTSDAEGVASWQSAPSGTVPLSGTTAGVIMYGNGANSWNVSTLKAPSGTMLELPNQTSLQSNIPNDNSRIYPYDDGSSVRIAATKDDGGTETTAYIAEMQEALNNFVAGKPGYYGDGTDDYLTVTNDSKMAMGTDDFSFGMIIQLSDYTPSAAVTLARHANISSYLGWIFTLETNGNLKLAIGDGSSGFTYTYTSTNAVRHADGKPAFVGFKADRDGYVTFYDYFGSLGTVNMSGSANKTVTCSADLVLFQNIDGSTEYAFQALWLARYFNTLVTPEEMIILPYKYCGASQTNQVSPQTSSKWINNEYFIGGSNITDAGIYHSGTGKITKFTRSGTQTLSGHAYLNFNNELCGKKVRVTAWTKAGNKDITTVRIANQPSISSFSLTKYADYDGSGWDMWYATGVVLYNSSGIYFTSNTSNTGDYYYIDDVSVYVEGCVLDLNPAGIGLYSWMDGSGNALYAIVSGATTFGDILIQKQTTGVFTTDIAAGTANKDIYVPPNYTLNSILLRNYTSGSITNFQAILDPTGDNVTLISGKTIAAGKSMVFKTLADHYSNTTAKILRFNATGNTSPGIEIVVTYMRRY